MTTERRRFTALYLIPFFLLGAALLLAPNAARVAQADPSAGSPGVGPSLEASKEPAAAPSGRTAPEQWVTGVERKGGLVIISKEFARRVREKNTILLSKVAIKARLDENGSLRGYEAVQIDKGSVVERMGFRPHDLVIGVNAIPARDLEASQESLESADRFDVAVKRKGKTIHLRFEIR
jgi:predicted metalloprotease with PDZ domain